MDIFTYSDKDIEELFNFSISEKNRFLIQIIFLSSIIIPFIFVIYMTYLFIYNF